MSKPYILKENSIHQKFMDSIAKIQFFGGGFGNGKTSAMTVKALKIARDYPGANILMARETYPKLNDTLRKTFIDFCPPEWIESFPMSKNSDNTCTLINGTQFHFRYIAQRKSTEDGQATSNLLSATYDLVVVDQIEDPGIIHKDFMDILGRLRGNSVYRGNDPRMPRNGPRWFMLSSNPTRNWVYKVIIAPLKKFQETGMISDDLLCERDRTGKPVLYDGVPNLLIDLVEGSTYENAHVLPEDFITTLESTYTGQMGARYLRGEWAAYDGLVYPQFNEAKHVIPHHVMRTHLNRLGNYRLTWLYGYDFGIQAPSAFLVAFVDDKGNIFIIDGFHMKEARIDWQAEQMQRIRREYGGDVDDIFADPSIFKRSASTGKIVGKSVAEIFWDYDSDLRLVRGNNDIKNGIVKVQSYLQSYGFHNHPITGESNAPYLYVSDKLQWLTDEFASYYWNTNSKGETDDKPVDKNDHGLDALKYMLSYTPDIAVLKRQSLAAMPAYLTQWQERESNINPNAYRY